MGPDLELKGKSKTAPEVLVRKENVSASPFSDKKHLQPANASVMGVPPIEQTPLFNANEDVEVNITGITNPGKALVVEASSENVTEYSSSFDDTGIGVENDSALSDAEVESPMCMGNVSSSTCDGWHGPLPIRKKKLTTHWRRFISPLMWRCKWIELQLMQLRSQELKYERELAAYNNRKQHEFADFKRDGFESKSVPLSCWTHQNTVMKRRKRKTVEEESELKSYMSNHNIFSYYENKVCVDGPYSKDVQGVAKACNADDPQVFGLNNMLSSLNSKDSDKSLEEMIQKIEAAHSRVQKLRSRIDKVKADYNMEDLSMPKNAISSCEDMSAFLFVTTKTPQLEAPKEDTKYQILIHNQAAEEELHDHENIKNQLVEKIKVGDEEPNVPSLVRACSTSKSNIPTKIKKGKRKSRSKRK